jgi:hypothetical protein
MELLKEMKSTLIKNPTPEAFQEIVDNLPEGRTDLVKIINLLFERILESNRFTNLDVEWMNENEQAFKEENFSKEDLQLLQHVVEEFKKDNSVANMYTMTNRLPDDRLDLKRMV